MLRLFVLTRSALWEGPLKEKTRPFKWKGPLLIAMGGLVLVLDPNFLSVSDQFPAYFWHPPPLLLVQSNNIFMTAEVVMKGFPLVSPHQFSFRRWAIY